MRRSFLLPVALAASLLLVGCDDSDQSALPTSTSAKGCPHVSNLVVLAWADHAGLIPPKYSMAEWLKAHPTFAQFDGVRNKRQQVDVLRLYRERKQNETTMDAWDSLYRYYETSGRNWLYGTDLEKLVPGVDDPEDASGTFWQGCPA